MRTLSLLLATLSLTSLPALAQRPPAPVRAAPQQERPVQAAACELTTAQGLRLAFGECGGAAALASRLEKEVEVVEYRNGDSPVRASVHFQGGTPGGISVRAVSAVDPDDDGDGIPTAAAARRPGRVKVGRVTLRAAAPDGVRTLAGMWSQGDLDGDGFPLAVALRDDAGGEGRVELAGCIPVEMLAVGGGAGADAAPPAVDLTLRCRSAEMVKALDANPYARFVAASQDAGSTRDALVEAPAAALRNRAGAGGGIRLHGATLRGWSLEWSGAGARQGPATWTLEVRVDRIEMA